MAVSKSTVHLWTSQHWWQHWWRVGIDNSVSGYIRQHINALTEAPDNMAIVTAAQHKAGIRQHPLAVGEGWLSLGRATKEHCSSCWGYVVVGRLVSGLHIVMHFVYFLCCDRRGKKYGWHVYMVGTEYSLNFIIVLFCQSNSEIFLDMSHNAQYPTYYDIPMFNALSVLVPVLNDLLPKRNDQIIGRCQSPFFITGWNILRCGDGWGGQLQTQHYMLHFHHPLSPEQFYPIKLSSCHSWGCKRGTRHHQEFLLLVKGGYGLVHTKKTSLFLHLLLLNIDRGCTGE